MVTNTKKSIFLCDSLDILKYFNNVLSVHVCMCVWSFIHKYLLSTVYILGTVLGARDRTVNKTDKHLHLWCLCAREGSRHKHDK